MPKSPIQHNTQLTTENLEDSDISLEEQSDTSSDRNSEVSEYSEHSVDDVNDESGCLTAAGASNEAAPAQAKETAATTVVIAAAGSLDVKRSDFFLAQENNQLTLEDSDILAEGPWDTSSDRNSEVSEYSEHSVDDGIYYPTVAAGASNEEAPTQAKEEKTATTLAPARAEASNEGAPAQAKEEETATTLAPAGAEGTSAENTNSSIWEIIIQFFGRILDSLRECFRSSDVNSNNAEEEKLPAVNNNDGRNLASTTNTHNVSNFFGIFTSEPKIPPASQNSFNS